MADTPWRGRLLTPGQIAQRLRSIGCVKVGNRGSRVEYWKPPKGPTFSIRLDDCDDVQMEGMVEKIQQWVEEN